MSAIVYPSRLDGRLTPPSSRAHALRLIWAACLGDGGLVGRVPDHDEVDSLLSIGRQLGADIVFEDGTVDIFTDGAPAPAPSIECPALPSLRYLLPLTPFFEPAPAIKVSVMPRGLSQWLDSASQQLGFRLMRMPGEITFYGRPIHPLLTLQERAGAYWGVGWMMAMPFSDRPITLSMDEYAYTHPSIGLTRNVLERLEILSSSAREPGGECTLTVAPLEAYPEIYADAEMDWKSGAYYLGALLLAGRGEADLPDYSAQPEREFSRMLEATGLVSFSSDPERARVEGGQTLSLPALIDPRPYPALVPLLLVLATRASGPVRIGPLYPLSPLSARRVADLRQQLGVLGAQMQMLDGYLLVRPSRLRGGVVECGGDGRVGMALALAGLVADGPVTIRDAEAITLLSPLFWEDLQAVGADVRPSVSDAPAPPPTPSAPPRRSFMPLGRAQPPPAAPAPSDADEPAPSEDPDQYYPI